MSTKKNNAKYNNKETTDVLKRAEKLNFSQNDLVNIYRTKELCDSNPIHHAENGYGSGDCHH